MVQVTIVAKKKYEEYQNLLAGLISEKDKSLKAVSITEDEYRQNRGKITSANKIILLENSKTLKNYQNITPYKFQNEYGFRYGWQGNVAIIDIDESKVHLEDSSKIAETISEMLEVEGEETDQAPEATGGLLNRVIDSKREVNKKLNRQISKHVNPKFQRLANFGVKHVLSGVGSVGSVVDFKDYKELLRSMDIALVKKFVADNENGLNAFLNN
ncbi:hypothetical protein [Lactiplantibacillus plajomi]|uniref:Uncharacterized protein n=1 Tax=Lactiplantibacillus plajomi TaxID=1457217 RepID=A0ABV6K1P9_9LACO|nr:hypothetical protein [Lactiplantibacillus plajomi]